MVTMKGTYDGEKHCTLTHGPSQTRISTDAPKDNNGRGEAFSPTDLVGAALGSCALTTIAIYAEKNGMDVNGSHFEVTKAMQSSPRQISELSATITLPAALTHDQREKLEQVAHNCPVVRSLSPEVKVPIKFIYK